MKYLLHHLYLLWPKIGSTQIVAGGYKIRVRRLEPSYSNLLLSAAKRNPGFLTIILAGFLSLLPISHCSAQWKTDSATLAIDTTTAADDYEEEYGTTEEKAAANEDTATVETGIIPYSRTIPADTMAALRRNPSFAYMGYLDSLLRAEEQARSHQPPPPVEVESPSIWDSGIFKLLCFLAAIGLAGFVTYRLFAGQGFFFSSKKTATTLPQVEMDETADESDLSKALQSAVARRDYRLAVRYLFLISLQRLGEKGLVQLSSDKTNLQYATELAGKRIADRFARLSLQYEYVWFGNFQISEAQFSAIEQQHQQFVKEV